VKKIVPGLCAVLVVLVAPALARAAGPADASVEIIGASGPLLAQTAIKTTTTPVVKDGVPAHACTGTSAAGALETATAGDWAADYFDGLGYAATVIKGESHTFAGDGNYWGFYVNGRYENVGLCAAELQTGDFVQLWPTCGGAPNAGCYAGEPLQLTLPKTAAPGAPFSASVTQSDTTYDANFVGTSSVTPSSAATVGGASTGADGKATLSFADRGPHTLTARKGDRAPSTASVCVTDGADGFCGTSKPGAPATPAPLAPCVHNGNDGRCGTADTTPAFGQIKGVGEQQRFARASAPRALSGLVDADPSGLKDVSLRLTRNDRGHCSRYDAKRERFVALKRCGAGGGTYFSVGDRADWSYLLPSKLARGRYVLDLRTTDKAGNVDKTLQRGRNRIVFFVS
jgi:hypothetical protein